MLNNFRIEDLQQEIKRRNLLNKKDPLWLRQPIGWRIMDYVTDFILSLYVILLFPIWVPFWMAYKIHRWNQKARIEMAKEKGFDWNKYHG
jgi:hypothetical protein